MIFIFKNVKRVSCSQNSLLKFNFPTISLNDNVNIKINNDLLFFLILSKFITSRDRY